MLAPALLALALLLALVPLPAAAGSFALGLPPDSAVTVEAPSRLLFRVTNADAEEGLSRLTLRFPSGYRVTSASPPPGWALVQGSAEGQVTFRTGDETTCAGAIQKGGSLLFGVEVLAPGSRSVTPDALAGAEAEQSCRGVALTPPAALPSWNRLGLEGAVAAGPALLGVGGTVTVAVAVTNLSSVELAEVGVLLQASGTAGVRLEGPTPSTLTLAPGVSGTLTWNGQATSAGTLAWSAQALAKSVTAPPARSETLFVGDLDVSLSIQPEQVESGRDVQVQMTVKNLAPVRLVDVVPSALELSGTATTRASGEPTPPSRSVLEPGESVTFTWAVAVAGQPGDTYAVTAFAAAEGGAVLSPLTPSNQGTIAPAATASGQGESQEPSAGSPAVAWSGGAGEGGGTAAAGGSPPIPSPAASVQFVGIDQNGAQTGGLFFAGPTLRDLLIRVAWANVSGSHTQRLDLFSPDGSLYQRLSAGFSGSGTVEVTLPVGGTWITQHSLYGSWRLDVLLDGRGSPITSTGFTLAP